MKEVLPFVFIGDIDDLKNEAQFEAEDIKFVISVCVQGDELPLPAHVTNHITIPVPDDDTGDLLSHFGDCNAFITRALEESCCAVLVHCVSGISRSATVIMAYVMASQALACPLAFRVVKKIHRPSCPNEAFRKQLKLYEAMKFTLDDGHPEFRMYRLLHAIDKAGANVGEIPLAPNPTPTDWAEADTTLSCRKCRMKLATGLNIMEHEEGTGQLAFRWRKRDVKFTAADNQKAASACSSLFIEPMEWMRGAVGDGAQQEKLCCPKCSSRFGMFNWSGDQCSCGAWIVPAFKINKGRVDVIYRQETRLLAEGVAGLKIASPVTLAAVALATPSGRPEVINITKRVFVPSN